MINHSILYTSNGFKSNIDDTLYENKGVNNFILQDSKELNNSDINTIMNTKDVKYIYKDRDDYIENPNNMLNDPIRNRGLANDPSIIPDYQLKKEAWNDNNYTVIQPSLWQTFNDRPTNKELFEDVITKKINNKPDTFWLDDPFVLFKKDNFYKIIPTKNDSKIETLNSFTRLFVYLAIIYVLFSKRKNSSYFVMLGIIGIIILYQIQKKDKKDIIREELCTGNECHNIDTCQLPSENNPFMNVTMADLMNNPDREKACVVTDGQVKKNVDKFFYNNMFTNVDDLFHRDSGQRQFLMIKLHSLIGYSDHQRLVKKIKLIV
jgi:hypothetical protein